MSLITDQWCSSHYYIFYGLDRLIQSTLMGSSSEECPSLISHEFGISRGLINWNGFHQLSYMMSESLLKALARNRCVSTLASTTRETSVCLVDRQKTFTWPLMRFSTVEYFMHDALKLCPIGFSRLSIQHKLMAWNENHSRSVVILFFCSAKGERWMTSCGDDYDVFEGVLSSLLVL